MINNLDRHHPERAPAPPGGSDRPAEETVVRPRESAPEGIQGSLDCVHERLLNWRSRNLQVSLAGNRLRVQPWVELSSGDRDFLREHRVELKAALRDGVPQVWAPPKPRTVLPPTAPEPEQLPIIGFHQLTESDIRQVLVNEGDELLADYLAGRLPREAAVARATAWHRQYQLIGGRYASS